MDTLGEFKSTDKGITIHDGESKNFNRISMKKRVNNVSKHFGKTQHDKVYVHLSNGRLILAVLRLVLELATVVSIIMMIGFPKFGLQIQYKYSLIIGIFMM